MMKHNCGWCMGEGKALSFKTNSTAAFGAHLILEHTDRFYRTSRVQGGWNDKYEDALRQAPLV